MSPTPAKQYHKTTKKGREKKRMLSSSRRLAFRLAFQRTRIPTTVQLFRTQSRKLLNWLKKKTASNFAPEEEEEEEEKEIEKAEIENNEKAKPHAPILDLPLELMLMINDLLPLEARCCLALTCKGLFEFNSDAVEAPEFDFLPSNPYDRRLMKNSDNLTTERWSLLRLLENSSSTYPQGINTIAERIKASGASDRAYLLHGCILHSESTCVVTKIRACLGERGDLFIHTQYAVFISGWNLDRPLDLLPRVFCPHLTFYHYFRLYEVSQSEFKISIRDMSGDHPSDIPSEAYEKGLYCKYCDTTIYVTQSNHDRRGYRRNFFFEVATVRNMGRGTRADDTWRNQTAYPSSWSGFGDVPHGIKFASERHFLSKYRDRRRYDPWNNLDGFCYRRAPTLTKNESHRWPAILGTPLIRRTIHQDRKNLRNSEINIDFEKFGTMEES
ncbi:hypothetical protein FQN53_008067 [Emmonsiellopsis sp. PD_33]|nr:hypothetical protein FQN53_008067 [Emmonsiellopsis sp. PD_33]KAK2802483.1 hypothetical protein FQN51_004546 [Onygenales sp. PD_10]